MGMLLVKVCDGCVVMWNERLEILMVDIFVKGGGGFLNGLKECGGGWV